MNPNTLLEIARSADYQQSVPDEARFKERWRAMPAQTPFTAALHSGLIADRLSWVFIGAYQSAVRTCFPAAPDHEWLCFAVSEDRSGTLPGTRLTANRLSGMKTWIAAVEHVDALLVTIGPGINAGVLYLPRTRAGISFRTRPRAGFLGDMTQGQATFNEVVISQGDWIDPTNAAHFAMAEACYVTAASCSYLLKESLRLNNAETANAVLSLLDELQSYEAQGHAHDPCQLLRLYQACSALGKQCAALASELPGTRANDWDANGRLLGLYGGLLKKTAAESTDR